MEAKTHRHHEVHGAATRGGPARRRAWSAYSRDRSRAWQDHRNRAEDTPGGPRLQRETDYRINDMVERKVAAEDQFRRSRIVSPHAGIVHGLSVTTVGGVIAPGDDIMLIIPQREPLIAEVRVQPQDIDQLHIGQGASLRFSAFDQSTTPDCRGELRHVSPDLTSDARTGATFYLVRIDVVEAEAHCLGSLALRPGMPVEAFLATQRRTVLSYLTKPLADQIARAFRDG
jgi:HlyD family secretion protein